MSSTRQISRPFEGLEIIHSLRTVSPETDLIMALGKNLSSLWKVDMVQRRWRDHLSTESRLITYAAGLLWQPGRTLLFSGGKTIGPDFSPSPQEGPGYISQPVAAVRYLRKRFPYIPAGDILIDDSGSDTERSAQYLSELVKPGTTDEKFTHPALLSVGFHHYYASLQYEYSGAPIESYIAAEDIFAEQSPLQAQFIERWRASDYIQHEVQYAKGKRATILANLQNGLDPLGNVERARLQERISHIQP